MVSEVEELEVPSVLWRGGGYASRELRRIHQRVRNILADWLDYYCMATGTYQLRLGENSLCQPVAQSSFSQLLCNLFMLTDHPSQL